LRTSTAATLCGVVTITAPSRWLRREDLDDGERLVAGPGGESMIR
jgi:hypothetical protein